MGRPTREGQRESLARSVRVVQKPMDRRQHTLWKRGRSDG